MDSLIELLGEFHFIRPLWLLGLLALVGIRLIVRKRPAHSGIDDLVDAHLQSVVVDQPRQPQAIKIRQLPTLLGGLLIIALAGPTWERLPQPLYQLQQGRVVVLSLAKSMDRTDMQPSRLQRAKFKIEDLLASMPGVLTGLIGFAGEAFVITPLSDDLDTISNLLQSLDSDTLPVQGIRAGRGLEKARELLSRVNINAGEIILVSDRASPLSVSIARALSNDGLRVSVMEVAPQSDASQSALLRSIAQSGRGTYVRIAPDDKDIERLNLPFKTWLSQSQNDSSQSQRKADQWRDFGPWLLLPVLILSSLIFRQGLLGLLPIGLLLGLLSAPQPVRALDWLSLWERGDQRQKKAIRAYRNNDMQAALQGFSHDQTATGAYNRGNALANSQQLEAALEAYDEALKLQPDFEDARYNRQIIEAALAEKQEQQKDPRQSEAGEQRDESGQEKNPQQGQENSDKQGQNETQEQEQEQEQEPEANKEKNAPQSAPENPAQQADRPGEGEEKPSDQDKTDPENQQQAQASEAEQSTPDAEPAEVSEADATMNEEAQALELMLRQVPDDPGALLRRKFKHQYQNQQP